MDFFLEEKIKVGPLSEKNRLVEKRWLKSFALDPVDFPQKTHLQMK